jgi:glycosyltransferase involved in cell wall biosynthesis
MADGESLRLLIVVPAFNEEESVGKVVAEIKASLPDAGVLVIDDASGDNTRDRALEQGAMVVTLPFNLGVGGAMRTGFRFALREDYDVVVQVDGDGQHDPQQVPQLLAALQEADVVIGARFAGEGSYQVRGPRRWAMRVLSFGLSRIAKTRLTDTTSGFRASNRRAIQLFALHYPAEYLGDTVESIVISARSGLRIKQVPVSMRVRTSGRPSQSAGRALLYLLRASLALCFAGMRWRAVRPNRPDDEPCPPTRHEEAA